MFLFGQWIWQFHLRWCWWSHFLYHLQFTSIILILNVFKFHPLYLFLKSSCICTLKHMLFGLLWSLLSRQNLSFIFRICCKYDAFELSNSASSQRNLSSSCKPTFNSLNLEHLKIWTHSPCVVLRVERALPSFGFIFVWRIKGKN